MRLTVCAGPAARGMLAACAMGLAAAPAAAQDAPLNVMATIAMIGDVAAEIGGECAAVDVLVPTGADPHLYEPTAGDVGRMQRAELILVNGYGLEGRLGAVLGRLGETRSVVMVAEAAGAAAPDRMIATEELSGTDPHLWMSPAVWALTVPVLAEAMSDLRPACAADIAARAADYAARLAALDGWVRGSMESVPESARVLVSAHDAFEYYARDYGLRVAAIQGLSTEAEASIADIRETAEAVLAAGVPAVFVETTINPRTIQSLVDSVTAQGGSLTIGGELFSDAMGDPGTLAGTYIGMIRHNTETIVTALGGTPAPLPAPLAD